MKAVGWYQDPYKRHEARWFSEGTPTELVRDGHRVAHDVPPSDPPQGPLVLWDEPTIDHDGRNLRRADALQEGEHDVSRSEQIDKVVGVALNPGDTEIWQTNQSQPAGSSLRPVWHSSRLLGSAAYREPVHPPRSSELGHHRKCCLTLDLDQQYPRIDRRGDENKQDSTEYPVEASRTTGDQAHPADHECETREQQSSQV